MQKKNSKKKIELASYISTPRVAGNNKGKFKKLCFLVERNYWHFKLRVFKYCLCPAFLYSELICHFLQSRFSFKIICLFTAIHESKL